jgi:L-iditol 2-dehydrogenase
MQMRAAYLPEPGKIEVGEFPVPEIGEGDVLVRMRMASICGSDLHVLYHGFHRPELIGRPGYPGHEGVGEVVESRSPRFAPGQRVLTVPNGDDGSCFAEYVAITDRRLVLLPDGDERRLLLAQQLGTTVHAMAKFWPRGPVPGEGKTAAVMGAGSAGLFFLQQIIRLGFDNVIVSDLDADRLEIARQLGADVLVHAGAARIGDAIADASNGRGADLIVEAAGFDELRAEAVASIARNGVVGCFGFPELQGPVPFPTQTAFRKAASVLWAGGAQAEPGLRSFHAALQLITTGAVAVDYCAEVDVPLE